MNEERRIQLAAEVDTTRTRAGFNEIGQQASGMAASVARSGEQAQRAVSGIGEGASAATQRIMSAQRNLIASIQRETASVESSISGAARGSAEWFESLARQRGVDPAVLAPYLEQLRAIGVQQERLVQVAEERRAAEERLADAARAEAQAQREAAQAQGTRDSFVESLRGQAEAIGRTRSELLELRAAQLGVSDQAAPFITRLREAEGGLARTGVSAAQTAAALRSVGPQFTDIVTSIQGGQPILTVALQQGGQLRDMFGSIGGAARALAGYIVSLVTPLTVVAAAVVALAFAYQQGSKEADAYQKAIVMTGNVAGVTSGQLAGLARKAADTAGTVGQNADVIAKLVGAGVTNSDQLVKFSSTAIQSQKYLGVAIEDTAKAYAELGKDPLQVSLKLNEQFRYLTLATYQQIKALQEQGKTQDASKVAQQAYTAAQDAANQRIAQSLGTAERAWNAVKGAAKGAWDAMLDVGREETVEQKIAQLKARIAKAEVPIARPAGKDVGSVLFAQQQEQFSGRSEARSTLSADKDELALQEAILRVQQEHARITGEDAKSAEAAIKFDQQGLQYLTTKQRVEKEIAAARADGAAAAQRGEPADVTQERVQNRIKQIYQANADFYNQTIAGQVAAVQRLGAAQEEQAKRAFIPVQAQQDSGRNVALDDQAKYVQDKAALDERLLQIRKNTLQQQLALAQQETVSIDGQAAHEQKLAELRGQIDTQDQQILTRRKQAAADALVLDVQNTRQAIQAYNALFDSRRADLDATNAQVNAQRDQNEEIGLSAQQLNDLKTRRVDEAAAIMESNAAVIGSIAGREDEAEVIRRTAQAMRDLNSEQILGANKQRYYQQYDDLFTSIDQAAKSTFTDMSNGFSSVFKKAEDSLRSGLLAAIYELTAKPILINLKAQMLGASLTPEQAAQQQFYNSTGYQSTGNNPIAALSNAAGLFKLTSGAGSAITAAGNLFGSSAISAFGSGLAGGTAVADAAAAYAAAGQGAIASALTAGSTVGAIVSTAMPYVAAAVVAYKAWGALFGSGKEGDTRLTFGSNNAAGNISINERGNEGKSDSYIAGASTASSFGTFGVTSTFWAPAEAATVQNFVKTVGLADDALAKYLTTSEKAGVTSYLTGKTDTAHVGAEGGIDSADAGKALAQVFNDRIMNILEGIEPGLSNLEAGFQGTSAELATEVEALLAYRAALRDSGEAVFGAKVTLQQIAALKTPTESTAAALTRITNEFNATNQVAQILGKDMSTAFGAAGLASEAARAQIILLSGGLDNFAAQANSFAQNYLSDAERLAPITKQLDMQLAALGLKTIPQTKEQFKNLVSGLDLSSESGQKLYAGLMNLQDAFAQVHASEKSAAEVLSEHAKLQDQLDQLTMTQEQLAEKARNAIDGHNLALYDQVIAAQAAKDAIDKIKESAKGLLDNVNNAYSVLQAVAERDRNQMNSVYQAASDSLQASIDSVSGGVTKLQSLSQSLHATLDSITVPGSEKADRQAAQAQLEAALAIAKAGGPLPDVDSLKNALATVSKDASSQFSSYLDYQRDVYRTKNTVSELAGFTDTELSTEERALKALQDQKSTLDANHKSELAKLDDMLTAEKNQVDLLNGIATSLVSLPQALSQVAAAIASVKGNPIAAAPSQAAAAYQQYLGRSATSSETDFWQNQAANGVDIVGAIKGSDEAKIQGLYQSLLGRKGDAAGVDVWEAALKNGMTWDQVKQGFLGSDEYKKLHPPGFAAGGDHVGGLRLVGENGPELEATGPSRIFNASQTRSILSGGDNSELVAEIRALRRQVANLENSSARTATSCETGTSLWKRVIRNDRLYASTKEEAAA
jgi:phage-related minor tail protein